nr:ATP-binding cassette domain-containing protein [Sphaerochaetaceae bacterium]
NYFTLSGGEAQKVNLSRALAAKSRLFVLDEPTASLDSKSRDEIADLLSSLRFSEMPTILLVSHDDVMNRRLGWPRLHLEGGHLA